MDIYRYLKHIITASLLLFCVLCCRAQQSVNALFIGNSYTAVNDLPLMVQQIATSMGDELTYQSNTPGGCTFSQHCTNMSMDLIRNGRWDIVVLQEQSQYPSFPQEQVEAEVFPYAKRLVDSSYANSPCCEPMFYMTWGRKNGDAGNAPYFPVLGTYEGMDSMLCERYTYMAHQFDASLCPVGRVWRYIRTNHPDIELYQSDESHPSVAGTYAAACAFYVMFFERDPELITYKPSISENMSQTIRSAVKQVVFERLSEWKRVQPNSHFEVETAADSMAVFTATPLHADSLQWFFGDGETVTTTAAETTTTHHYADTGHYAVMLVASRHCMTDTFSTTVIISGNGSTPPDTTLSAGSICNLNKQVTINPNPATVYTEISSPSPILRWHIADSRGRIVSQQAGLYSNTVIIRFGRLVPGLYIITVYSETGMTTKKIVVL